MKKACGTWLLAYVVIAALIGAIVYRRFPDSGPATMAAVIGGLIAWIGVAYLVGIRKKLADAAIIRRALNGDPPRDGEKIAAIGRIEPTGPPLTAPLSGVPCVAYKYEIKSGSGEDEITLYDGFALTPSAIFGPQGSIRLLAWPDLKVAPRMIAASEARRHAEEYISNAEFRQTSLENLRQSFADMLAVYRGDDGSVRSDTRHARATTAGLDAVTYREWVVRRGDAVCVTGHFSAQRGGIVPAASPLLDPVMLDPTDPHVLIRRSYRGVVGYLITGVILAGGVAAALIALYAIVPLEAAEQMSPSMRVSWPEIRLERLLDQKVRPRMREAGMLADTGNVSIMLPPDSATGRARSADREQLVTRAIARRDGDRTIIEIDGDVVVLTFDNQQVRSLRILGRDVDPTAAGLRLTANSDTEVTGRLTYWSDEAACRVTFKGGRRKAEGER